MSRNGRNKRSRESQDARLPTTAEELAGFTMETIDIAQGLGDCVVVGGHSGGGTIATWVAQNHRDVDRVIAIALGYLSFYGNAFKIAPLGPGAIIFAHMRKTQNLS